MIIHALLLELKNEETLASEAEIALQYWIGCGVAPKNTRLIDYRLHQFWKHMDLIQEMVYKDSPWYGGPEVENG